MLLSAVLNSSTSNGQQVRNHHPYFPYLLTRFVWLLFFLSVGLSVVSFWFNSHWHLPGFFAIDGLTLVIWMAVTFFSGIVHTYSLRYMAGNRRINAFFRLCVGFTLSVMLLTVTDHLIIFAFFWLAMGLLMAKLIGHNRDWEEAKISARHARVYFVASTLLLVVAGWLIANATGTWVISGMINQVDKVSWGTKTSAALLMVGAAMIQSALFPFQSWLMSSMTAPTPASALMHAGFVNAGGILLTRFAPLMYEAEILWLIVIVGGIGALFGKFWKFAQANYKRKLGCSTVSQMGFMILQCGLGFFTAAITHLILHGFYKAFLFLLSGANIQHTVPSQKDNGVAWLAQLPLILVSGLAGGWLFAIVTGKDLQLNSSLFLIFVVVLTIVHGTQDILKRTSIAGWLRAIAIPSVMLPAILVYALIFHAVSRMMLNVPMVQMPTELTWAHWFVTALYLFAFLVIEFEWYKFSRRLYVALLNITQPHAKTVLTYKR